MADSVLHAQLRIYRANLYYKSLLKTAITSKCGWRRRIARRELRKLKMAARETGELREAKERLEKHVEQLMRRFKIILNYLQETKDEEIATLKDALYDMQNQLEEANSSVIKEQEAARIAIEETPSVIADTPVLIQCTEKVDSLTAEVESLKAMQLSERHQAKEVRKTCTDAEVRIAELAEKMENSERKVDRLQDSVRRLEEKLSTSESEDQVLRQQAHTSLKDKQQENQDLLIKCILKNVGFSGGKPVAACVIYKCLLHWGTFEVKSTSLFDRIIQTIGSSIEVTENNDALAYWLSNSCTLLFLFRRTFKKVEAPAFLFKQQLTACLEKIYGMIRDCIKKEMSPLLGCFIIKASMRARGCSEGNSLAAWQAIVKRLRSYLETMKANHVHPFLIRKILTQIFAYINVQLFNSVLLRRECCSFSNGEHVKAALAELERWCCNATNLYAGSAWDELKHIRQAVDFLVFREKSKMTLHELMKGLCPVLSQQQLYRICTIYGDDKYGTQSVSSDVISNMGVLLSGECNNSVLDSFLLYDDSSIPFSVDDILVSMRQFDLADVDPPPLLRDNSAFKFLQQHLG